MGGGSGNYTHAFSSPAVIPLYCGGRVVAQSGRVCVLCVFERPTAGVRAAVIRSPSVMTNTIVALHLLDRGYNEYCGIQNSISRRSSSRIKTQQGAFLHPRPTPIPGTSAMENKRSYVSFC